MSHRPAKILIFDSGLGGLTIFETIRQLHPTSQLVYCSDNEAFPYGNKTEPEVTDRVNRVLTALNNAYSPDIFVIACNTASTVALPKVRSTIAKPVVGVVPAIKPAGKISKTRAIGLLATPGTIKRDYTQTLIDEFAPHFNWIKIGSSELVLLAENKMYGIPASLDAIKKAVAPLTGKSSDELDTVVLACTHFPLLIEELRGALPNVKNWIDSSDAIANRVGFWLHETGFHAGGNSITKPTHELVFTKKLSDEIKIRGVLEKNNIKKITLLAV